MIKEVMLVSGQVIVGRVHNNVMSMPHTIELLPSADGRSVNPTLIPFGSFMGMLPPITDLVLEDHKLMYPPREVDPNLSAFYIKSTTGIEIAKSVPNLELVRP